MTISRRKILAGAAASAAVAAMRPAGVLETAPMSIDAWIAENFEWPMVPIDRQTFFDGRIDWTFYARRREWIGIDRYPERAVAEFIEATSNPVEPSPDDYDLDEDGNSIRWSQRSVSPTQKKATIYLDVVDEEELHEIDTSTPTADGTKTRLAECRTNARSPAPSTATGCIRAT